jgi:hypothetical protein
VTFAQVDCHLADCGRMAIAYTDLNDVDRVAVPLALGVRVDVVGVFPRLRDRPVVPDVALVRKAVGGKSQFSLLHILDQMSNLFTSVIYKCWR